MGIIFHFDDFEKMQPDAEITFAILDFIADQLGNMHL